MDVFLVPGLWLDARSWDPILPALEAAGHRPHPLTMPGVGLPGPQVGDIGIAAWVAAVVAEVDAVPGPVTLVGHSGGGNVVWGAADARPDRVARVVLVDTVPPPAGMGISEFEVVDGVVPFPGWAGFDEEGEAFDLDGPTRARIEQAAQSVPPRTTSDGIELRDERRHDIPVTLLMGTADAAALREQLAQWGPWAREFEALRDAEVVRLGTGHWPQYSAPDTLAEALVAAIR